MLLFCSVINNLWDTVECWIFDFGLAEKNVSNTKKIPGNLENGPVPNPVMLFTKKVIYDSFKHKKLPCLSHIKMRSKTYMVLKNISITQHEMAYLNSLLQRYKTFRIFYNTYHFKGFAVISTVANKLH